MSGIFPDAQNIDQFWENIKSGVSSVKKCDRWENVNQYGALIDNIDKFDSLFFNISPAEAEYMDPQQRLFLQEAWKAL
ncbi:MAG: beta-ketoacyl synthase N-terminal-like domain-containing protein, partial [Lachnospiraceae bacterium]